jgi:hypothetical protein
MEGAGMVLSFISGMFSTVDLGMLPSDPRGDCHAHPGGAQRRQEQADTRLHGCNRGGEVGGGSRRRRTEWGARERGLLLLARVRVSPKPVGAVAAQGEYRVSVRTKEFRSSKFFEAER